jgi:hypothetical protein
MEIKFQIIKSFRDFKIIIPVKRKKKKENFHKYLAKIILVNYKIFKGKVLIVDK